MIECAVINLTNKQVIDICMCVCVCKCVEDEDHSLFQCGLWNSQKNHAIVSNKWPNKSLSRHTNEFAVFSLCSLTNSCILFFASPFSLGRFWRLTFFYSNLSTSNLHAIHYLWIYWLWERERERIWVWKKETKTGEEEARRKNSWIVHIFIHVLGFIQLLYIPVCLGILFHTTAHLYTSTVWEILDHF